jgi:hypothetical protein
VNIQTNRGEAQVQQKKCFIICLLLSSIAFSPPQNEPAAETHNYKALNLNNLSLLTNDLIININRLALANGLQILPIQNFNQTIERTNLLNNDQNLTIMNLKKTIGRLPLIIKNICSYSSPDTDLDLTIESLLSMIFILKKISPYSSKIKNLEAFIFENLIDLCQHKHAELENWQSACLEISKILGRGVASSQEKT